MARIGSGKKAMSAVRAKRQKAVFSSLHKTGATMASGMRAGKRWSKKVMGKKRAKPKARARRPAGVPVSGEVEAVQRTPAQNIRGAGLVFIFGGVAIGFKALLFGVVVAVAGVALFAGAQRISGLLWPEDSEDEGDGSDGEG